MFERPALDLSSGVYLRVLSSCPMLLHTGLGAYFKKKKKKNLPGSRAEESDKSGKQGDLVRKLL